MSVWLANSVLTCSSLSLLSFLCSLFLLVISSLACSLSFFLSFSLCLCLCLCLSCCLSLSLPVSLSLSLSVSLSLSLCLCFSVSLSLYSHFSFPTPTSSFPSFGNSLAPLMVTVIGMKLMRSVLSDLSRQYMVFILTLLFFNFDYQHLSEGLPLNYFIIAILFNKVCAWMQCYAL